MYPRGELFLTELPGKIRIKAGSDCALTVEDMNQHIRRGEAVRISGQWFRVSSEVSLSSAMFKGGFSARGARFSWEGN